MLKRYPFYFGAKTFILLRKLGCLQQFLIKRAAESNSNMLASLYLSSDVFIPQLGICT